MWSWHAKAPQIAVSGISNFTFLRSIGTVAIGRPNPLFQVRLFSKGRKERYCPL
jgi:hypothetical protein